MKVWEQQEECSSELCTSSSSACGVQVHYSRTVDQVRRGFVRIDVVGTHEIEDASVPSVYVPPTQKACAVVGELGVWCVCVCLRVCARTWGGGGGGHYTDTVSHACPLLQLPGERLNLQHGEPQHDCYANPGRVAH